MTHCYSSTAFLLRRSAQEIDAIADRSEESRRDLLTVSGHLRDAWQALAALDPILSAAFAEAKEGRQFCDACREATELDDIDAMIEARDALVRRRARLAPADNVVAFPFREDD